MTLKIVSRSVLPIVGIDLGTTNSLVSVLREGTPHILPNSEGKLLTPSAVSVSDSGEIFVGAAAYARRTTHPDSTALAFKRDMGTERRYQLGPLSFSPQELSALVLRNLKQDAEASLGVAVNEAVITVPAYFDESQRRATRDAASIAGLTCERIINEPTAAALAYGLHERNREFRAMVLDLGGGTFDVTILEVMEGVIEIRSTAGDTRLGGEDFADELAKDMNRRLGLAIPEGHGRAWALLRAACENAKRQLSSETRAVIDLPTFPDRDAHGGLHEIVTRDHAEIVWSALLGRFRAPILRALRDASIAPKDIDEVLLVGGATRMPCIAALAAEIMGKLPSRSLPPDEAVGLGAAVQAALKARDAAVDDLVVTDVAPFSMGIATMAQVGSRSMPGIFSPILERGTVIPASRVETFQTVDDNQTMVKVEIFQGEHSLCKDNKPLGVMSVGGLPKSPAGEVTFDVRFTYDLNGLLEVEATVPKTGKKVSLVVENTPGRLNKEQLAAARSALAKLKFHPRESLPNATALHRAESAYAESTGDLRSELGARLAAFRVVLESQDVTVINEHRARLSSFLDACEKVGR